MKNREPWVEIVQYASWPNWSGSKFGGKAISQFSLNSPELPSQHIVHETLSSKLHDSSLLLRALGITHQHYNVRPPDIARSSRTFLYALSFMPLHTQERYEFICTGIILDTITTVTQDDIVELSVMSFTLTPG